MNRSTVNREDGFTIVELLVSMVVSVIAMSAIYAIYTAQNQSHAAQRQIVQAQQNVRAAVFYLTRAIRMAGYDPTRMAGAGFVSNFPTPNDGYGATTNSNHIAFTVDADGDGTIDDDIDELFAFRLDSNKLEVFRKGTDNWQTIAENIAALSFTYKDENKNAINPVTAANIGTIRSVEISIVAAMENNSMRTRQLTKTVQCRNLYFG